MKGFGREARQQRAVLEALATVGEAGMTPLALAVTTQLPEHRLQDILQQLTDNGVVQRRAEHYPTGARLGRARFCLTSLTMPQRRGA